MAGKIGRRVYRTREWAIIRRRVFKRDGHKCVMCGRRSGLECDHLRRITDSGSWFDLSNLRTLCRGCHIKVTREANSKPLDAAREALRNMALAMTD